ncbi:MAG: glycosyltransferase [Nitrosarchaeum sp.]|nr:glycosyltransferase [Nitrosarchaeum sp.]
MTNYDDKVSIVLPVYNSEKFLQESIESVLNQSYENTEIIAVNDGSTDKSLEILNQYSDRITIMSQENQGLASALMRGIGRISGKWFKWFSPDDLLFSDSIRILVEESHKVEPNTVLYSDWEIIDSNGDHVRDFHESNHNKLSKFDYNVRLLDGQLINVNTALIPSEIFKKGIVFANLDDPVAIDYDFFLRCAILNETRFHLIPKPLVKYRMHSNQLSHKSILQTLDYIETIKSQLLSSIPEEEKTKYLDALKKYQQSKSVTQKTMNLGLRMLSKSPPWLSDRILNLYLAKIRRSR